MISKKNLLLGVSVFALMNISCASSYLDTSGPVDANNATMTNHSRNNYYNPLKLPNGEVSKNIIAKWLYDTDNLTNNPRIFIDDDSGDDRSMTLGDVLVYVADRPGSIVPLGVGASINTLSSAFIGPLNDAFGAAAALANGENSEEFLAKTVRGASDFVIKKLTLPLTFVTLFVDVPGTDGLIDSTVNLTTGLWGGGKNLLQGNLKEAGKKTWFGLHEGGLKSPLNVLKSIKEELFLYAASIKKVQTSIAGVLSSKPKLQQVAQNDRAKIDEFAPFGEIQYAKKEQKNDRKFRIASKKGYSGDGPSL